MELKCETKKKNGIIIFTILEKKVNHSYAASFKEKMFLEIANGNIKIILDMNNVSEIDSSGLGALLFGKRQADNAGGNIVLVAVHPSVQSIIRIAQLSRVFDMYNSVDEALSAF
jgi:anti-sigma B factor antagonist